MHRKTARLFLFCAPLLLAACANNGGSAPDTAARPAPEHRAAPAKPAAGAACRSTGSVAGRGKNDAYMCKASAALNSAEAREVLDPAVRVSYGSAGGNTDVSRQTANATGKSPDETCQRAFLNAVKRFQSTAQRKNKKAVRLVSYFDKKTIGGSEYECHIGTWNSRVVLKGSYH